MSLRWSSLRDTYTRAHGSPLRRTTASPQMCCFATGVSNSSVTPSPTAKELSPEALSTASEMLSQCLTGRRVGLGKRILAV